jgi:hypothetical protein
MRRLIFCLVIVGLLAGQAWAIGIVLEPAGTYATGVFDDKGAQILDYHPASRCLYITNASDNAIDVVDIHDIDNPTLLFSIDSLPGAPLSVGVHPFRDLIAVACEGEIVTDPGTVAFYRTNGEYVGSVGVGPLPDMLAFTHNGKKILVANEGEPTNTEYEPEGGEFVDPEGSVSIITLGRSIHLEREVQNATVVEVGFGEFNDRKQELLDKGVRIFGPGATVAQDLEPEYITISKGNKFAWVTLQENNAIAKIDIKEARVVDIFGLGYKDHSVPGNALDASNKDDAINIANWPVLGMYLPDAIASFLVDDQQYIIVANEGDAREFEEIRVGKLESKGKLGDNLLPFADNEMLGRLKVTTEFPAEPNEAGKFDVLYSFGARSFTILTGEGQHVSDTGDEFAQITAIVNPDYFNSTDDESEFDNRSDDKGAEPEHVVVAKIAGHTIAFMGLERIGGIMTYDVSDPANPVFLDYVNNRNFEADPESPEAGDLGTEGMLFIPAHKSPTRRPLLAVSNEISGSTTVYRIHVSVAGNDNDE